MHVLVVGQCLYKLENLPAIADVDGPAGDACYERALAAYRAFGLASASILGDAVKIREGEARKSFSSCNSNMNNDNVVAQKFFTDAVLGTSFLDIAPELREQYLPAPSADAEDYLTSNRSVYNGNGNGACAEDEEGARGTSTSDCAFVSTALGEVSVRTV